MIVFDRETGENSWYLTGENKPEIPKEMIAPDRSFIECLWFSIKTGFKYDLCD